MQYISAPKKFAIEKRKKVVMIMVNKLKEKEV